MDYIGDKEYWNGKFINRSNKLMNPEKSIVDNIKYFKRGSILDIACGDGRNAIFLAEKGFNVTGIDFSNIALKRLQIFAKEKNFFINTKQINLKMINSLNEIGIFDNILINHYRLDKLQFKNITNHVRDNGILFICGFGHKHKVDSKIRKQDLIQPNDFEYINEEFKLIKYNENQDNRGFFVTYIFQKTKFNNKH